MSKTVEVIRLALLICFITAITQGEVVYFLVGEIGEPFYNDCYVLPLSNSANIAHARDLIGYGPGIGNAIVVATIWRLPPRYSMNRNYLAQGLPGWSWQVSFNSFAGMTAEILDGWPTWVEQDPLSWPSGSTIGFWDYTVIAELGTNLEPWNCDLNIDGNINFSDFSMVASNWAKSIIGGPDINNSGRVDIQDLAVLADNWLDCFRIPASATYPNPADNAVNLGWQIILRWLPGKYVTSHDVYFGTNETEVSNADTTDANAYMENTATAEWDTNNYDANGFECSMTYFWRIDEITPCGIEKGQTWSFSTLGAPYKATDPVPTNGAVGIDPNAIVLHWTTGIFVDSHDVYLGVDFNDVNEADMLSPEFKGSQTAAGYEPCNLDTNTTYFWRIDEKNPCGATKGDVWSFKTVLGGVVPNLVSWWKFDEGSGTIANDSAGGNNGTVYGGATWITGPINGALNFDGSNDYVGVPDNDNSLDMDNQVTISAWIKVNNFNNLYFIVNKQPSGTAANYYPGNYQFGIAKRIGYLLLSHQNGTDYTDSYTSTSVITAGVWQHVAVTLQEGVAVKFYINGSPAGTSSQTTTFGIVNNEPVRIGTRKDGNSYFNGAIDDIRIYNRALSDAEIQQLYQEGSI